MKLPSNSKFVKTLLSVVVALIMLAFGVQFVLSEGVHLVQVQEALGNADRGWLYLGIGFAFMYVGLHSEMYRQSFKALGLSVGNGTMTRIYLKRTFVSVFLPAGFLSSQAFFTEEVVRSEKVNEEEVLSASGLFVMSGLLSMVILVAPSISWLLTEQILPGGAIEAFLVLSCLVVALVIAVFSFIRRGIVFRWCQPILPAFTARFDALDWARFRPRYFLNAILLSCMVELVGVFHVYVAARAMGIDATLPMAFTGYMAVLVVLMTSPFLRGVGAAEALLALVLTRFGVPAVEAVSCAVLFRFFEFWMIMLLAIPVFLFRPRSLLVRMAPSILLFFLGLVNVLSSLTPTLSERARILDDYLPLAAVHASAALTVAAGFVLLATSFYLYRGLRSAWWTALCLSIVSLISHLAKGFDYEEAFLALLTIGALLYQHRKYNVRTDLRLARRSWLPTIIVVTTTLILGSVGFYWLDHRHFGADFTWSQSVEYALQSFVLMDIPSLHAMTLFGAEFLAMMHILGTLTMLFIVFMAFRPFLPLYEGESSAREKALELVSLYGHSSLDYFKTSDDKRFFFPQNGRSFVAYKNTARYALALENPVAPNEILERESIAEFDHFCRKSGLRSIYYRIPEASAALYRSLGKFLLPLGQEAVVNLTNFTLDGKERKSMRNALNKMEREGYQFVVHEVPLDGRLLQQLRAVSDEWLRMLRRSELSFSQGVFDEDELRNQTVLTLENAEGKILAFINLIPGACVKEANFDLMRRTADSPHGTMDYMFSHMFIYLKSKGYDSCNLGLVPMSGLDHPTNLSENLLKLAYERIPRFANYKSLRYFKEKFDPVWETKYVAYDDQLDLLNLPIALGQVVRV